MLIAAIGLIFFFAGTIQGLTGFGAALVAIPLLVLLIDIKIAVPLCVLNGLVMITSLVFHLRRHMDLRKILPLIIGSIPGVILGTSLLTSVSAYTIKAFLGVTLMIYSLYNLFTKRITLELGSSWGVISGFLTGTLTAMVSAGGPPTIIYTALTKWDKQTIKATLTGFFAFNTYFTVTVYVLNGVIGETTWWYFAFSFPFVLLGAYLGTRISSFISREIYIRLIYIFLFFMGAIMICG